MFYQAQRKGTWGIKIRIGGIMENTGDKEVVCYHKLHREYPRRLLHYGDMPPRLFVRGVLPREDRATVAIVGARMCSYYGQVQAFEFAKALSQAGVQIISGMARGIDGHAHRGALAGGTPTFAVLGCGVDVCYPRSNYDLYKKIPEQGGLLSEFPLGYEPLPRNFPLRNRIISGLADLVLVIEAKKKSGSLITADCALEQGKTVYALPGRVSDGLSYGCNRLIEQGAGIACSVESLLEELGISPGKSDKLLIKAQIRLESQKNMVYSCLDLQPQNLNQLLEKIPLSPEEVMGILLELQLEELIVEPMKNYYAKIK